jgi:hypothetical protein
VVQSDNATAPCGKDGLFFYIATLHTVDVCRYKAEPGNAGTVAAHPLLFDLDADMGTKCTKVSPWRRRHLLAGRSFSFLFSENKKELDKEEIELHTWNIFCSLRT